MNYISIYDHITGKRLAFLQNAYDIGYAEELNQLWTASFTLPLSDAKNKHCKPFNYVEIFDGQRYVGLFRIMPSRTTKNAKRREVTYECEHVLATLIDDVLLGWNEIGNTGVFTPEVIRYILDKQTVTRWVLNVCDFNHQFLYGWEDENLLAALFSVPQSFQEQYKWDFDTSSTPWLLSLRAVDPQPKADIRYRKNMLGIIKDVDPSSIVTRLYPYGYGEGVNKLNIKPLNNGVEYLDSDTQNKYGVKVKVWKDERYQMVDSLFSAAKAILEEAKEPYVSYSIDAAHIGNLKNCRTGDLVRVVDDDEGTDLYARILTIEKDNVTGAPDEAKIVIANRSKDLATTLADISDRQRISEVYSQGAVTLFMQNFYDNCSPEYPAEFRFYIPANVVHINEISIDCNARPFRGYTKGTKNSDQALTTTQGGGGYSSSSERTSSAGGTQAVTSDANNITTTTAALSQIRGDTGTSGTTTSRTAGSGTPASSEQLLTGSAAGHKHYYYGYTNHTHSFVAAQNHSHDIWINASHSHTLDHTHTVKIGSHTHSVTVDISIPAHTHQLTVPAHAHAIEYGIYRGPTASSLTLVVDGNTVGAFGGSLSEVNIIAYLGKDDAGKVTRGRHTVQIIPDTLTRVEADLVYQLYANSRGGGQN